MTLAAGSKLGPYEILDQIGAGGMGEVYRARDTRLDRTVAVKVLPRRFAEDAEMRRRFEREARAISALTHPHICGLHDVGSQEGIEYLVMEYLDGETLVDRLARGPLPAAQAMRFGAEIADALAAAHRAGIVHRDLKPGNVMLTKSGVKLLDFGLAKPEAPAATANSVLPTQARPLTERGTVLGTFQYMSPEQLEGKEADARSDIFALGAVLYEMLTGKKAFTGASQASLITAIMSAQPTPVSSVDAMAPPTLDRLVQTCLSKDPDERWQSAHDVAKELRWIGEGSTAGAQAIAARAGGSARRRVGGSVAWIAAGVALLAAAYFANALRLARSERPHPIHSFLIPPERTAFHLTGDDAGPISLSPDGEHLVFGAGTQLWVQSVRTGATTPLTGTDGARFPFWSPDGRSIGFFTDGQLKTKDIAGGPVQVLCDVQNARGGTWGKDGVIVFAPDVRGGLVRVAATGGKPAPLTRLDTSQHTTHRWPWFLPDGRHLVYLAASHEHAFSDQNGVFVVSVDGKENRRLMQLDGNAQFAGGRLFWVRDKTLYAQRFDPVRAAFSGDPVRIQENVHHDTGIWRGTFTVSDNGLLAYQESWNEPGGQLAWFDLTGKRLSTSGERSVAYWPRLSPDGKHAALLLGDPNADVWVQDLERGVRQRATSRGQVVSAPVWSSDGSEIAFLAQPPGRFLVVAARSDGSASERTVLDTQDRYEPTDWSSDGKYILCDKGPLGATHIWAIPVADPAKAFPVVQTSFAERSGQFSPDTRWVAYRSLEPANSAVYVTPFPDGGAKWQVSLGSATQPRWSRDGRTVYFLSTNNELMAADVDGRGPRFEAKAPRTLFRTNLFFGPRQGFYGFDVSPDPNRLLLNTAGEAEQPRVALVVHWDADLPK